MGGTVRQETHMKTTETERRAVYPARLESEAADPVVHEAYVEARSRVERARSEALAALRERVRRGEYRPDLGLLAERILVALE